MAITKDQLKAALLAKLQPVQVVSQNANTLSNEIEEALNLLDNDPDNLLQDGAVIQRVRDRLLSDLTALKMNAAAL